MHICGSSKVVEVTHGSGDTSKELFKAQVAHESGDKSEEPLKAQAALEEPANEWGRSVFFPYREAPSRSVLVFDISSVEDLSNTIELGLNPQEKNISGSKKRKKNTTDEACLSKNIKKKGIVAPTKKLNKGKTPPSKSHGKKGSSSVEPDDSLEPCPNFPFEPLARSFQVEDESVIRKYLEQHFTSPGSADCNLRELRML